MARLSKSTRAAPATMTASTSIHPLDYGVAIELLMPMPTATTRPLPAGATATPWRAYLRRAEWLLVEQVLLRGESAWTVFIRAAEVSSVEEACNSAAAGNITDFYRALLAPPESGDDARYETLSALVIPRTHPPFVVACSLRTRLMLLELWHFVGLRSRGAAIEQTVGTAAAATKHGGAATLNISTHDGGRTTAANGVAAPRIFAPSIAAPSIDLHPDDVYFTLDEDWECYRTWRALQEDMRDASDAQHDKPIMWNVEDIPGLGKLSHLLQKVEVQARRLNGKVSVARIRQLLQEINPKPVTTSKWANDDRIGQGELYEHLDRVLETLKNFKEHSFPFLQKVNRREAPDYYDIIKNPMDFATMSKKLKMLQYTSKQEFSEDLQLIWNNCLHYNTDPVSVYRVHAKTMQERAEQLLRHVPNIIVKTRAELEADGYDSDQVYQVADDGDDASDVDSSVEAGGDDLYEAASSKIDVAVPLGVMQEDVATSITEEAASVVCRVDLAALQISTTLLPSSSTELPTRSYPSPPKNIAFRSASSATFAPLSAVTHIDDTDDSAMNDPAQRIWEMRGEWIAKRLVTDELPFGERPALVRTSVEMEEYAFLENLYHVRRMLLRGQPVPATVTNSDNTLSPLAADEDAATAAELEPLVDDLYFFPEFCHATGSLPDLYDHAALKRGILGLDDHLLRNDGAVNDLQLISRNPFLADVPVDNRQLFRKTSDETTRPSLHHYESALISEPGIRTVKSTVETYRECKYYERKLMNMLQQSMNPAPTTPLLTAHTSLPDEDSLDETRIRYPRYVEPPSDIAVLPPLVMTDAIAHNLLTRSSSLVLTQAGFEGSSAHCLQVFSEIAESFLENIGAIFGSLMDTYHGGSMTFEDIIMQTLRQSGVPSIDALLYSIDREPAMVISNLRRRKHKLHDYLEALVTPSDTEPDPEDMDIDDDVAFVMGDFGESIGDDYLGLRAMGLRGVDDVPERLWNVEGRKSKLRTRRLHKAKLLRGLAKSLLGEDLIDVPPRYPGAVPFAPVTNALSQIGLLRPFFERKFSETAVDVSLVEDEFLPPKVAARKRKKKLPRLTGKAEQSPKRNRKKVDLDALDGTK